MAGAATMLQCAATATATATATAMVRGGSPQGRYGTQSVAGNGRFYIRKKGFNFTRCQMGLPPSAQIEDSMVSSVGKTVGRTAVAVALGLSIALGGVYVAEAKRLEGVNKPELLPKEFTTVIDVAGFLSSGQQDRIKDAVASLEQDTGYKLRVLAQNYPNTPGLAVREFWNVDDNTVVFVADPSLGNILNFNVGAGVDLSIPRSFWNRLQGKYGNKFYWQEMGEDASIEAAVSAIGECLREPAGPRACADIK